MGNQYDGQGYGSYYVSGTVASRSNKLDRPDVLWILIDYQLPYHLDPNALCSGFWPKKDISKINFIFINEDEIEVPTNEKSLCLKKISYSKKIKQLK